METIEPTTDPETDAYPHYYEAAKPRGYIHSTLVYADLQPSGADCLVSAGMSGHGESIHVAIEYEDGAGDVEIGVGADMSAEEARLLARSLNVFADMIDA